jgi:hypothetical protein
MPPVITAGLAYLASWFQSRHTLHMEILALRHQLAVYQYRGQTEQMFRNRHRLMSR